MKKSLLAVAAIGAFASAAQAQSSVTVYGILDVGYVGGSQNATVANVKAGQTVNQFGQSASTNSRLGFKGVEDLGGGMSAFFTVETLLTPQDTNYTTTANRQSFVGLKKNGIGAFSLGQQYTIVHNAIAATDPGQLNNVVGSVIAPLSTGLTGSSTDGNSNAYTTRAGNMLAVNSDTFAGFQGNAFYVLNNSNTTQATTNAATVGGTSNSNGWGLGVNYTWKKLLVTANYQSFKAETSSTSNAFAISATNALTQTNTTDAQQYYAATYDFGILKAYAGYINRKITSATDSNAYLSRSAQQIGVRGFVTPTIETWASVGTGRFNGAGVASPTSNFNAWQLGSNYYLSKRTNLYAIYGKEQTSSTQVAGANYSQAASNYAVGVKHTF